jgi:hypothetical protein
MASRDNIFPRIDLGIELADYSGEEPNRLVSECYHMGRLAGYDARHEENVWRATHGLEQI